MEASEIKVVSQLSIEQKLAVREAEYQAVRLQQMAQQAGLAVRQLIEKFAKELGVDPATMLFNEDSLQFVPKQT